MLLFYLTTLLNAVFAKRKDWRTIKFDEKDFDVSLKSYLEEFAVYND